MSATEQQRHPIPDIVDTIARRIERSEQIGDLAIDAAASGSSAATDPSSICSARFGSLTARLAQLSARAAADVLTDPARAHDPVPMERIVRYLSDVRRIADAIAEIAAGAAPL